MSRIISLEDISEILQNTDSQILQGHHIRRKFPESTCTDFFFERDHFGHSSPHLLVCYQTGPSQEPPSHKAETSEFYMSNTDERFKNHLMLAVYNLKNKQMTKHRKVSLFQQHRINEVHSTRHLLLKEVHYLGVDKCLIFYEEEVTKLKWNRGTLLEANLQASEERNTYVNYIDMTKPLENIKTNREELLLDHWDSDLPLNQNKPHTSLRHKKYIKFSAKKDFIALRSSTNLIHVMNVTDLDKQSLARLLSNSDGRSDSSRAVEIQAAGKLIVDFAIYEDCFIRDDSCRSIIVAYTTYDLSGSAKGSLELNVAKIDFNPTERTVIAEFNQSTDIPQVDLLGELDLTQLSANKFCCVIFGEKNKRIQDYQEPQYRPRCLLYRIMMHSGSKKTSIARPFCLNLQTTPADKEQLHLEKLFSERVSKDPFRSVSSLKASIAIANIYSEAMLDTKKLTLIIVNQDRPCDLSFHVVNTNGYTFKNFFNIINPEETRLPYKLSHSIVRSLKDHMAVKHSSPDSEALTGFRYSVFINKCYSPAVKEIKNPSDKERPEVIPNNELSFSLFDQKYGKILVYSVASLPRIPRPRPESTSHQGQGGPSPKQVQEKNFNKNQDERLFETAPNKFNMMQGHDTQQTPYYSENPEITDRLKLGKKYA